MPVTLSKKQIKGLDAYWRAADYISVGQIRMTITFLRTAASWRS